MVHGQSDKEYNELFRHYTDFQGDSKATEYVSLSRLASFCACPLRKAGLSCTHNAEHVVIEPTTGREGIVVTSNVKRLPSGATVRIRSSWTHVKKTADADGSAQNTIGSPSMLKVVAPSSGQRMVKPKAAKVHTFKARPSGRDHRSA